MSDMRIQYNEEMVGAGHPTKFDTLNRLVMVESDDDGHGLRRYLRAQTGDPETASGECVFYAKSAGGRLGVFLRGEGNGEIVQLASGSRPLPPPRPVASWSLYGSDQVLPAFKRLGPLQTASFANSASRRLGFQEPVLVPGLAHRLMLDLAMSSSQSAGITLRLAYKVISLAGGPAASLTTDLWRASHDYAVGEKIIGLASDGWREYAVTGDGGGSGSTPPVWPASGTVADNGLTWTAGGVIFKNLTLTHGVTAGAGEPFRIDSADLAIPAAEITGDSQQIAGFLLREAGAGHTGDLHLIDGHLKAVEA